MVFSKNVAEHLMEIYHKLKPTLHLPESREEWNDALRYAITSAKHFPPEEFVNVTKQIEQEGDIPMSPSLLDILIAEGKAEGIAEGKAEGEAKGEAKGEVKAEAKIIIRILTRRLKLPSKSLQKKINSIQDIAKLDELADFALTCVSLEEFATALK
jgi:flagellar biosynthesis/type III secretory pathway protein FliH